MNEPSLRGKADNRCVERAWGWVKDSRPGSQTRDLRSNDLHLEAKFGVDVSEAQRLKALEEKNTKLKKLLVERSPMWLLFASFFQTMIVSQLGALRSCICTLSRACRNGLLARRRGSEDDCPTIRPSSPAMPLHLE